MTELDIPAGSEARPPRGLNVDAVAHDDLGAGQCDRAGGGAQCAEDIDLAVRRGDEAVHGIDCAQAQRAGRLAGDGRRRQPGLAADLARNGSGGCGLQAERRGSRTDIAGGVQLDGARRDRNARQITLDAAAARGKRGRARSEDAADLGSAGIGDEIGVARSRGGRDELAADLVGQRRRCRADATAAGSQHEIAAGLDLDGIARRRPVGLRADDDTLGRLKVDRAGRRDLADRQRSAGCTRRTGGPHVRGRLDIGIALGRGRERPRRVDEERRGLLHVDAGERDASGQVAEIGHLDETAILPLPHDLDAAGRGRDRERGELRIGDRTIADGVERDLHVRRERADAPGDVERHVMTDDQRRAVADDAGSRLQGGFVDRRDQLPIGPDGIPGDAGRKAGSCIGGGRAEAEAIVRRGRIEAGLAGPAAAVSHLEDAGIGGIA